MKIVINTCFGGFGLSHKAKMLYAELSGFKLYPCTDMETNILHRDFNNPKYRLLGDSEITDDVWSVYYFNQPLKEGKPEDDSWFRDDDIERSDVNLIKVVEQLSGEANGSCADLKIVEIPDDVDWEIEEYDGNETVAETHRTWN